MSERVRDLEYYLSLPYSMKVYPATEGGFVAEVEELPGCITQVEAISDLPDHVEDAKRAWIAAALQDGAQIPLPSQHHDYSGKSVVRKRRTPGHPTS